eukprot:5134181-Lingulodinium_polyedra.AAC.1
MLCEIECCETGLAAPHWAWAHEARKLIRSPEVPAPHRERAARPGQRPDGRGAGRRGRDPCRRCRAGPWSRQGWGACWWPRTCGGGQP